PKGPGVVLIGHDCDYFIDEGGGRPGLLHNRKRGSIAPEKRLEDLFRRTLHAAALLQSDPALNGAGLRFSPGEFLFRINDRLAAPKARGLPAAHAAVTVVTPALTAELSGLAAEHGWTVHPRPFVAADLEGAWLAVAAAPPEVNRQVAAAAEAARVFMVAVDDP